MRTHLHLLTAACLMTSAFMFVGISSADTTVTQEKTVTSSNVMANNDKTAVLPPGITAKDLNSDKAIEKSFKGVTEDALDKTGFDNVIAYLSDQDQQRIKKSTDKTLNNLDGNKNKALKDAIANLDGSWQKKYGKKFKIDYKAAYTADFLHILTGEVNDPSLLIGQWPVGGQGMQMSGKVTPADANEAKDKNFGGKVNLEKGRDVAIAQIMSSHGMPGVTASLIHETASGWHFDIPNTVNAETLYNTLVSNLTQVNNNSANWPADVNDGYRAVTHAVVLSLYNVDLQKLPKNMASER